MLKLKLQYFGHLMRRTNSLEKTLMLGKTEGRSRRRQQKMRWLDGITDLMDMNMSKLREVVMDREACSMGLQRVRHAWVTKLNCYLEEILSQANSVLTKSKIKSSQDLPKTEFRSWERLGKYLGFPQIHTKSKIKLTQDQGGQPMI